MVKVKMFPALYGDCFLISVNIENESTNILVDGWFTIHIKII